MGAQQDDIQKLDSLLVADQLDNYAETEKEYAKYLNKLLTKIL